MVTEEKIWDYLDGSLNEQDHAQVEYAIANNKDAALLHKKTSAIHSGLHSLTAEQPSMAFTENVIRALQADLSYTTSPKIPLLPLLIAVVPFITVLVLASIYLASSGGDITQVYHIKPGILNIAKMLFILTDAILLVFFLEDWFLSRRNRMG